MKKFFLFFLLLGTFLLTGCGNSKLEKISVSDLNEKMNNNETFVLYFASEDSTLEKTLNDVLEEYDITGYKIDINKIEDNEKNDLKLKISYDDPCIVFIINGKDPSILSHVTNESTGKKELTTRLRDMHFIKEE